VRFRLVETVGTEQRPRVDLELMQQHTATHAPLDATEMAVSFACTKIGNTGAHASKLIKLRAGPSGAHVEAITDEVEGARASASFSTVRLRSFHQPCQRAHVREGRNSPRANSPTSQEKWHSLVTDAPRSASPTLPIEHARRCEMTLWISD
jgi:hypothetical protein